MEVASASEGTVAERRRFTRVMELEDKIKKLENENKKLLNKVMPTSLARVIASWATVFSGSQQPLTRASPSICEAEWDHWSLFNCHR